MKKTLLYISCCFICAIMVAQNAYFPNSPLRETRAVWITTLYGLDWPKFKATDEMGRIRQKHEFCSMLDSLNECGINTVLLQTRIRGTVIYPSAMEPWDMCMAGSIGRSPGYDPLAMAVDECHRRGMQLHAWVVALPYCKTTQLKQYKSKNKALPNIINHEGTSYFDPSDVKTSECLSKICCEIASKYDIDGISLDYIRYPENVKKLNDKTAYRRYSRGMSLADWRRDNITRIVSRIYTDVKAIKPWIRVTSSPVGKSSDLSRYRSGGWNARDAVFQDVQGWMRDGIHDGIFPMMYFRGNQFYPFALDWNERSYGCDIAPGLGIYLLSPKEKDWPLEDITRELEFLRANGMGQCYFRASFLLDNHKGLYDWLKNWHNRQPAIPCSMQRYADSIPEPPANLRLILHSVRHTEISWDRVGGMLYNVYVSDSLGAVLVASSRETGSYHFNPLELFPKGRKIGVKAMNKYGIESQINEISIFQ